MKVGSAELLQGDPHQHSAHANRILWVKRFRWVIVLQPSRVQVRTEEKQENFQCKVSSIETAGQTKNYLCQGVL